VPSSKGTGQAAAPSSPPAWRSAGRLGGDPRPSTRDELGGHTAQGHGDGLSQEFLLWRLKRLPGSTHPVNRELHARVQLLDDLAEIDGLRLEPEAASRLKVQVYREHRAAVLQVRRPWPPMAITGAGGPAGQVPLVTSSMTK